MLSVNFLTLHRSKEPPVALPFPQGTQTDQGGTITAATDLKGSDAGHRNEIAHNLGRGLCGGPYWHQKTVCLQRSKRIRTREKLLVVPNYA